LKYYKIRKVRTVKIVANHHQGMDLQSEQKAFGLKVDVKVVDKKIILAAH
jgi:hypothetical protein